MKIKDLQKMDSDNIKVSFKTHEYLLIGGFEEGWAIATKEQYENFLPSYAHLFPDGRILMYQQQIGTIKDLHLVSCDKIQETNRDTETFAHGVSAIVREVLQKRKTKI